MKDLMDKTSNFFIRQFITPQKYRLRNILILDRRRSFKFSFSDMTHFPTLDPKTQKINKNTSKGTQQENAQK